MPLVLHRTLPNSSSSELALWQLTESEQCLSDACTPAERAYATRFSAPARRREWLGWHALLHQLVPHAEAAYAPSGAPILRSGGFISVSHTRTHLALLLSDQPCAVDLESRHRNFARSASRYLTSEEITLLHTLTEDHLCLGWCAKEVLYKRNPRPALDFLTDIRLRSVDHTDTPSTLIGSVQDTSYPIYHFCEGELLIAYSV